MVSGRREEMARLFAFPSLWAPCPVSPALKWAGYFAAGNLMRCFPPPPPLAKDQLVRESHKVLRPVVGWDCKAKDGA